MTTKFIAYQGVCLTLEWYYTEKGKSEALEYYYSLSHAQRDRLLFLFKLLGDRGNIFNKEKFRYEGDKIYALKASKNRFLCFFYDGAKIVITNAYAKQSSKMPKTEKLKAL